MAYNRLRNSTKREFICFDFHQGHTIVELLFSFIRQQAFGLLIGFRISLVESILNRQDLQLVAFVKML